MLSATHRTHSTLRKIVSKFSFLTCYIFWPSFQIGMLFHWEWYLLFSVPLKQSRNRPILKLGVWKAFTNLINGKVILRLQRFTDNFSSPAVFSMLMHITSRAPVSLIKISPHNSWPGAFSLAMRCCALKFMATTSIDNLNCGTRLEEPINRWGPVLGHPFLKILWLVILTQLINTHQVHPQRFLLDLGSLQYPCQLEDWRLNLL